MKGAAMMSELSGLRQLPAEIHCVCGGGGCSPSAMTGVRRAYGGVQEEQ